MKVQRAWYPFQLFVRKWEVVAPLLITIVSMIALLVWMLYALRHVPQPVFLHYSIEVGVDAIGSYTIALALPGLVILYTLINAVIANLALLSARNIALLLVWSTVPLAGIAWWFGILLLRVNGA